MIISMTGFGRAESSNDSITVNAEVRSVNSRFLEITSRMPKEFTSREAEIREIIRSALERGKINLNVTVTRTGGTDIPFEVDADRTALYKDALMEIRKAAKIKETVNLSHLLVFRDELLQQEVPSDRLEEDWKLIAGTIKQAADNLQQMRKNEGRELARELRDRLTNIDKAVDKVENISKSRIPEERKRLRERIARLFEKDEIDEQRLEFEIVLLADKLDVTEECVRYRSHSKYFNDAIGAKESTGRKLNFLLQEMLREINTIGSKSNDAKIAHLVVEAKEELEKIREQVQNIE